METQSIRLEKHGELVKLLGEGRNMEEFAASGQYNFEEFYAAKMDARPTTSIVGSAARSIYFAIRRPFDETRWGEYASQDYSEFKTSQNQTDSPSRTDKFDRVVAALRGKNSAERIRRATDTFKARGSMADLDLSLYSFDEIFEARILAIPVEKSDSRALVEAWYFALKRPLDMGFASKLGY